MSELKWKRGKDYANSEGEHLTAEHDGHTLTISKRPIGRIREWDVTLITPTGQEQSFGQHFYSLTDAKTAAPQLLW